MNVYIKTKVLFKFGNLEIVCVKIKQKKASACNSGRSLDNF